MSTELDKFRDSLLIWRYTVEYECCFDGCCLAVIAEPYRENDPAAEREWRILALGV